VLFNGIIGVNSCEQDTTSGYRQCRANTDGKL
jgi:hypothetical protein